MELALIGNDALRALIHQNLATFPSQIPTLMKCEAAQERIVQLYFVHRWSTRAICQRYGLGKSTVRKLLSDWRIRAISAGYIQEIHPDVVEGPSIEEYEGQDSNTFGVSEDAISLDSDWGTAAFLEPYQEGSTPAAPR